MENNNNNTWLSPEQRAALARQRELEAARQTAARHNTARPAAQQRTAQAQTQQGQPQTAAQRPTQGQPAARTAQAQQGQRHGTGTIPPAGVRAAQPRSARPVAPVRAGEGVPGDTREMPRYVHTAKRGGRKPPQKKTRRTTPPIRIQLNPRVRAVLLAVGALVLLLIILLFCGVRSRVAEAKPAKSFEGLPITLISAAIVSLSFFGFAGIIGNLFG